MAIEVLREEKLTWETVPFRILATEASKEVFDPTATLALAGSKSTVQEGLGVGTGVGVAVGAGVGVGVGVEAGPQDIHTLLHFLSHHPPGGGGFL